MPNDTIAIHPSGLKLTFTEENHCYKDEYGREYTSGTKLLHKGFEVFDAEKVAAMKSAKTGRPAQEYIQEWQAVGKLASDSGTWMHENCERQILGRFNEMHSPRNEEERICFAAAWEEVCKMQANFCELQPEKIIFSPRFRISGSIDLLAKANDRKYIIFDWKRIKALKKEGFKGKCGIIYPTFDVPDCNFYHYALQLSIYEMILKVEGYIPPYAEVERWLLVYRQEGYFQYEPLPDMVKSAALLAAWNMSEGFDEIPF